MSPRLAIAALPAACLTLLAGPALAQFDHSIYGVVDFSYGRFEPSGQVREHRFNSNSMTATFAGVSGSYGFESGWTVGANLESFFRLQDFQGGRSQRDPLLSRNAFASLAHRDYGTLRVGRLQTLLFNTTTRFNAFGNSVGFSPAVRHVFLAGNVIGVQRDFYWSQAMSYTSPSLGGVTTSVMAARGDEEDPGDLYGASVVFQRGIFAATVSAQRVHVNDGIEDPTSETTWQAGGNVNFGWANLFALYTHTRDRGLDVKSDIASVGASVPLGPGTLLAQIGVSKADGPAVSRKQTSTSAAYLYAWNSVTDLYVVAMDDRVRGQTRGVSAAVGVRYRFSI
jgi:predicted porin